MLPMKAIWSQVVDFVRRRPVWFVTSAWLLLALTTFVCFATFVGGAARFYASLPPQHQWANYDRAAVDLLFPTFWVALLTAITSSVLLGLGFRAVASASVAIAWVCLIGGCTLRLSLIEKGPEQFLRYAGQQKFLVPWRYNPQGADSPSLSGFRVFLCPDLLLGLYDEGCHTPTQRLAIRPAEAGIDNFWEAKGIWKFSQIEVRPAGVRNGYQVSIGTISAQVPHRDRAIFYFKRFDPEGSLRCLVICYFGSCRRQTQIGDYILDYDADGSLSESNIVELDGLDQELVDTFLSDRDVKDKKLAKLMDSWVVP
jgi:hypothetical protein